ncbi:MAG: hypothetical protein DSY43_07185 [Gammaproteobacteria bacterium]|nr:MAG: hypothetical protein DSY43_07185 [Gammaproteobacteria bacterium]
MMMLRSARVLIPEEVNELKVFFNCLYYYTSKRIADAKNVDEQNELHGFFGQWDVWHFDQESVWTEMFDHIYPLMKSSECYVEMIKFLPTMMAKYGIPYNHPHFNQIHNTLENHIHEIHSSFSVFSLLQMRDEKITAKQRTHLKNGVFITLFAHRMSRKFYSLLIYPDYSIASWAYEIDKFLKFNSYIKKDGVTVTMLTMKEDEADDHQLYLIRETKEKFTGPKNINPREAYLQYKRCAHV